MLCQDSDLEFTHGSSKALLEGAWHIRPEVLRVNQSWGASFLDSKDIILFTWDIYPCLSVAVISSVLSKSSADIKSPHGRDCNRYFLLLFPLHSSFREAHLQGWGMSPATSSSERMPWSRNIFSIQQATSTGQTAPIPWTRLTMKESSSERPLCDSLEHCGHQSIDRWACDNRKTDEDISS